MAMIGTVGIDIDNHSGYELLKTYLNARKYGRVRTWYTKHGFHLIIYLNKSISIKDTIMLRRILGDDIKRLWFDEIKIELGLTNLIDTLFEWKKYPDGSFYKRWEFCIK